MKLPVTRRGFLAIVVSSAICAVGAGLHRLGRGRAPAGAFELAAPVSGLADLFTDLEAATAVGEAYLRTCKGENIRSRLLSGAGIDPHTRVLRVDDFHARRRRDFLAGETLLMDGWLMARAEVCACALLACDRKARRG